MIAYFADTFYYLALLNEEDDAHPSALEAARSIGGRLVTTTWVLTEVADGLAPRSTRGLFAQFNALLHLDSRLTIIPSTQEWFDRGVALYTARRDKDWSLTDCISFVVMRQLGISEALTADHHFEQAGFSVLLR